MNLTGMEKMTKFKAALLASLLVLPSCASVLNPPTQEVRILTSGTEKANCKITLKREIWNVTTPASIDVERSSTPMRIACVHKSGARGIKTVKPVEVSGFIPGKKWEYPGTVSIGLKVPKVVPPEANTSADYYDNAPDTDDLDEPALDKPLNILPDPDGGAGE